MEECPLCKAKKNKEFIIENQGALAIKDGYPVTKGHTLVISRRHEKNFFQLPREEQIDLLKLTEQMKKRLLAGDENINGVNIGINIGKSAGQTIDHVHIHIIPRRSGDCEDPTGGVRGVIPEKQAY